MAMRALLLTMTIFCATVSFAAVASAQLEEQALKFKNASGDIRENEILTLLKTSEGVDAALGMGIAAVDLNGDGVDEWIVREDKGLACTASAPCRFFIVALKHKKPVVLAKIYAGSVTVLNQKMYGVNSLNVYNDPKDDFHALPYHWKPDMRTFSQN